MNPTLQRLIGFAPSEISAMVNEPVVFRHAQEVAFLWTLRSRAVMEPHYSLHNLATLDERVEANARGVVIARDVGWKVCKANLAHQGSGEVFAAAVAAFDSGDRNRMFEALSAGCVSPKTIAGVVSALGWLDYVTVEPWISRLLEAKSPAHRRVGIAACAIRRVDPGPTLALAIDDPDQALRARALRAVGELKRRDLVDQVRNHLRDEDDGCRFWSAWSLTLTGEQSGLEVLTSWFERNDERTHEALQVALRALPLKQSREWISRLATDLKQVRLAIMGAGIAGDPASIPWLIRQMASPDTARLAGEAFSMITGADLAFLDLDEPPPSVQPDEASIEERLELRYESNLAWPSTPRVVEWWNANSPGFAPGMRYLTGKPLTPHSAFEVLALGKQRQRAAAALELALANPDQPLFEVRARASAQQQELAGWTS